MTEALFELVPALIAAYIILSVVLMVLRRRAENARDAEFADLRKQIAEFRKKAGIE